MDDSGERTPLQALARAWPMATVLIVVGLVAGVGLALARPTTYTAESRLAVGSADLAAQAVPGFAQASAELAANYARFVATGPVRAALPGAQAARLGEVTASPVPDSNVIRLEATATSQAAAVAAAKTGAELLKGQVDTAVAGTTAQEVLAQYNRISAQVAAAQQEVGTAQATLDGLRARATGTDPPSTRALDRASQAVVSASAALYPLQIQQNALGARYQDVANQPASQSRLDIVAVAAPAFDDTRSRVERYGLAGLVLGFVLALGLAVLLDRRRQRRRPGRARSPRPDERTARADEPAGLAAPTR